MSLTHTLSELQDCVKISLRVLSSCFSELKKKLKSKTFSRSRGIKMSNTVKPFNNNMEMDMESVGKNCTIYDDPTSSNIHKYENRLPLAVGRTESYAYGEEHYAVRRIFRRPNYIYSGENEPHPFIDTTVSVYDDDGFPEPPPPPLGRTDSCSYSYFPSPPVLSRDKQMEKEKMMNSVLDDIFGSSTLDSNDEMNVQSYDLSASLTAFGINTDKLATDKLATDKPATDKPATDKPATDKLACETEFKNRTMLTDDYFQKYCENSDGVEDSQLLKRLNLQMQVLSSEVVRLYRRVNEQDEIISLLKNILFEASPFQSTSDEYEDCSGGIASYVREAYDEMDHKYELSSFDPMSASACACASASSSASACAKSHNL